MKELKSFIAGRKKLNLLMVLINVAVFIVFTVIGDTENGYFMLAHGACYVPLILEGEYYRLLTGMFLHFGLQHLVYNMLCLLFMGDILETIIGSVKYLVIYFLGGLGGNLLSMALELRKGSYSISAGASGAIFAVIGALLYIVIRNKGKLGNLDGRRLGLMVVLSVLQGYMDTGTDNAAHVGGLISGFLFAVILYRKSTGGLKNER